MSRAKLHATPEELQAAKRYLAETEPATDFDQLCEDDPARINKLVKQVVKDADKADVDFNESKSLMEDTGEEGAGHR